MQWVETTGKSVREAIDLALDRLGVAEQDAEWEVLEEPRGGLRGLFGGSARIRARVRPVSREKPRGKGRRERGEGRRSDGRSRGEDRREPSGASAGSKQRNNSEQRAPKERTRGSRGGQATRPAAKEGQAVTGERKEPAISLEEQVEAARRFVEGLVARVGVSATVTGHADGDDDVYVEVEGDGVGVLIGHRAATLAAIEELTRTAVQHRASGGSAYVHVDVQGYRERRRQALIDFALEVARRAIDTGEDQAFEPMPASDRKIVHDALQGVEGVATTSEGLEPRRRVVVTKS